MKTQILIFAFLVVGLAIPVGAADMEVGAISESDTQQMATRIQAKKFKSIGVGPFAMRGVRESVMIYGGRIGYHYEVMPAAEIRVQLTGGSGENASFLSAGIGANWLPLKSAISPIIGAEFGGGLFSERGQSLKGGYSVGGNIGARFFRFSDTQLEIAGHVSSALTAGSPVAYGVTLSLLY